MTLFGQVIVGPPGSGKTTYCAGMQQFYQLIGRKVAVVNLDPANDHVSYDCAGMNPRLIITSSPDPSPLFPSLPHSPFPTSAVDIGELISLDAVQEELSLGPNGGLLYAIDYLHQNLDWLQAKLKPLEDQGTYVLFDCPGQVELFTMKSSLKNILDTMTNKWNYRLTAIQLVDAHLCADPAKYLGALLLSLETMLHLELPQVNILSKYDLIEQYGKLEMSPEFYLSAQGLGHLADLIEGGGMPARFAALSRGLCEVIDDVGLVQFVPLAIEQKESVAALLPLIDRSNGYVWKAAAGQGGGGGGGSLSPEMQYSLTAGLPGSADVWEAMAEQYVKSASYYEDGDDAEGGVRVKERVSGSGLLSVEEKESGGLQ